MTDFTQAPGALTIIRTILALVVFCFLPGYFVACGRRKSKGALSLLLDSTASAIAESVLISLLLLGFATCLLIFSVGFGTLQIVVLESAITVACFLYWRFSVK